MSRNTYDTERAQTDPPRNANDAAPDFDIFTVRERGGDKDPIWTRIGAAWTHRDGDGHSIQLDANALDGKLIARRHRREAFKEERRGSRDTARDSDRGPERDR